MAAIHGKGGSVTWAGAGVVGGEVTSWSCDATADTAEITNMASADDWKEYLAGFKDWTATVEVIWDSADVTFMDPLAVSANLKLELVDAGANIAGTAICTGVSPTTDVNDAIKLTYSFQGNGALAYAAS